MSDISECDFDHCVVCLESGKLTSVCGCSVRYHSECFDRWLNTKMSYECEICRNPYRYKYMWWFRFRVILKWCVCKVDTRLVWGMFVYMCVFVFMIKMS